MHISNPELQVYTSIQEIAFEEIRDLLPDKIHLLPGYWAYLEATSPDNVKPYYVLIKVSGRVQGFCCFQLVHFKGKQLLNYLPEKKPGFWNQLRRFFASSLANPILPLIQVPLLVSGNVFMTGDSGFYFSPEIRLKKRAEWFDLAVEAVKKANGSVGAVLIPDMYSPKTEWDNCLEEREYYPIYEEADMVLSLHPEWLAFDDYLSAMSSKYRVRTRKVFQLSNELIREELSVSALLKWKDRMYDLYSQVMKNARFKLAELPADFFLRQKEIFGDHYQVTGYFKGEQLIGFMTAYLQPDAMDVHYTGMDYPDSYTYHLYQRMLYDRIDEAIRLGKSRLHFGRTAPEMKSTVGAVPLDTYGYVKHFSPVVNCLIVPFFSRRLKPVYYNYRSPFR